MRSGEELGMTRSRRRRFGRREISLRYHSAERCSELLDNTAALRNGADLKFIAGAGDLHFFPPAFPKDLVPKVPLYMRNMGSVSRAALHKQARQLSRKFRERGENSG